MHRTISSFQTYDKCPPLARKMSLDYNLDEVEASIRRCEEFISQNDCNISMLQRRLKENSGFEVT